MKEFSFKRSYINVESEHGKHKVRFPTMKEATDFDKALLDKGSDYEAVVQGYLTELGMPDEVYESLEYWQVKEILEYFRDPLGKEKSAQS